MLLYQCNRNVVSSKKGEAVQNQALKNARIRAGLTQAQLAESCGLAVQHYQRYEYGKVEPSVLVAIRIADALGVEDIRTLFG